MRQKIHMGISVDGALKCTDKQLRAFTDDDGNPLSPKVVRALLRVAQIEGKKVIPCGKCDNFDFQKGCLGHDIPDDEKAQPESKEGER